MGKAELDRVRWIQTFYPVPEEAAIRMVALGMTNEQISAAVIAWTQSAGMIDLDSILKLFLTYAPVPKPEAFAELGKIVAASPTHTGSRERKEYAERLLADFTGISQRRRR